MLARTISILTGELLDTHWLVSACLMDDYDYCHLPLGRHLAAELDFCGLR